MLSPNEWEDVLDLIQDKINELLAWRLTDRDRGVADFAWAEKHAAYLTKLKNKLISLSLSKEGNNDL